MLTFPYETRALRVEQPLGHYYVAVLPANLLLAVAFSDVMSASLKVNGIGYELEGTQRLRQPKRLTQIADYIDRADSAFPNSIILAANFQQDTGLIEDEEAADDDEPEAAKRGVFGRRWSVTEDTDGCFTLRIPTGDKLAAIIDGQHRLFAFAESTLSERLEMQLICSIFLDLPKPFQAQLFATINSTQKPVDKSLTYELFGYNISEEKPDFWTPDKLAVFLTRKLGTEPESSLRGRIIVAPKKDALLEALGAQANWKVSTAVIVEGILRLISSNPKRDTNEMLTETPKERRSLEGKFRRDRSPLRTVYFGVNDNLIYTLVLNYVSACERVFWSRAADGSFIIKTVGVQALFDILRKIAAEAHQARDISVDYFVRRFRRAGNIDFSTDEFRNASGSGRSTIRRAIEARMGL